MDNKEEYLSSLQAEYESYQQELSKIKKRFKKHSDKNLDTIVQALDDLLGNAKKTYDQLSSASGKEWEVSKKAATEAFENLKPAFSTIVDISSEQVKQYTNELTEKSHEKLDQLEKLVQEHPLRSILLSVGIGFLLGKIFK